MNTEKIINEVDGSVVLPLIINRFCLYHNETRWGGEIMIMEKNGKAFVRIYWYNDDYTAIYVENLSVRSKFRKQKIATELMTIIETIALELGSTSIWLWVLWERGYTWLHDWYIKIGYTDIKDHETEKDAVWMRKTQL